MGIPYRIDSSTTHKINSKMLKIALIAVCLAVAAASPIDLSGYTEDQKAVISFQLALANELAAPEVPGLAAHQAAEAAVLAQQGKNPGLIKHNLGLARVAQAEALFVVSFREDKST